MIALDLTRHPKPLHTEAVFNFPSTAIKALKGRKVGGYGVVFGSPHRRDREFQYFDKNTDLWLDHYDNQPVFTEHTLDEDGEPIPEPRKVKIGKVIKAYADNKGVYFEAELDNTPLADDILKRIDKGEMFWSSGAPGHLVRYDDDGRIDNWPLVELSATDDPAETHGTDIKLIKAYYQDIKADRALKALVARPTRQTGNDADAIPNDKQSTMKRSKDMGITFKPTLSAYHQLAKQYVDVRMVAIKKAVKELEEDETKMDGEEDLENKRKSLKEMLEEGLQEAAETVAAMAGEDPVQTMGMMVGYVMDSISPEAQAEVEDAVEEVVDDVEEEIMDEEVAPVMSRRKSRKGFATAPAYHTPQEKAVVPLKKAQRNTDGLLRTVKALINHDFHYLRERRNRVYNGYVKHHGKDWTIKALGTSPDSGGGYLVPVEQSNEIVGNLYDDSLFLEGNRLVTQRNMASSQLSIPRTTSAITTGHIGENETLQDNDVTFGQELLQAKKAYAMIRISREELEDSDPDVEQWYLSEVGLALAELVDRMVLTGSGVNSEPLGIANRDGTNKVNLGHAPSYADVVDAVTRVRQNKIKQNGSWGWVVNPREVGSLSKLEDTAGNPIWGNTALGMTAVDGRPPTLYGYPVYETNQVTISGGDTNVYFGDWKGVVLGVRKAIEIQMTDQRFWDDDQIAIRAILRYDVGMFRDEAIEILTGVG